MAPKYFDQIPTGAAKHFNIVIVSSKALDISQKNILMVMNFRLEVR